MPNNVTDTFVNITSIILLNPGYIKTANGVLKVLQQILGWLIVGLVVPFFDPSTPLFFTAKLLLLLIATASLITNACLLVSCLLSISATTVISKTIFEFVYNVIMFCLYLAASVYMLVQTSSHANLEDPEIKALISAGAFGVIGTILCAVSFFVLYAIRFACTMIALKSNAKAKPPLPCYRQNIKHRKETLQQLVLFI